MLGLTCLMLSCLLGGLVGDYYSRPWGLVLSMVVNILIVTKMEYKE